MKEIKQSKTKLIVPIDVDVDEATLPAPQVRLLKSLNALILSALTTVEEDQFFKTTEEIMMICAGIINQSHFSKAQSKNNSIPYAKQAIELSIDSLQEQLERNALNRYDH